MTTDQQTERIAAALDAFRIELPSRAFANTGARFGTFLQPAAATTTAEKFADAGEVNRWTEVCPTIALRVLWDLPGGAADSEQAQMLAAKHGLRAGSINPDMFEDQVHKYGSLGNPDPEVRLAALDHIIDSIEIAQRLESRDLSLWFADRSNYPGMENMRHRRRRFEECLEAAHEALTGEQRILVEYKPFEPALYHTDIADWGMALLLAQAAGPRAKVLVDTGHHYQGQNQVFRIFHEILRFEWETGGRPDLAYMIDLSRNLKDKVETMIQTVAAAMELHAKAALVDHEMLAMHRARCELVDAETCLKDAFATDARPAIREWRAARGPASDPMAAFRESGYLARITAERAEKNRSLVSSYA